MTTRVLYWLTCILKLAKYCSVLTYSQSEMHQFMLVVGNLFQAYICMSSFPVSIQLCECQSFGDDILIVIL